MKKSTALILLIVILLAGFFLREYRQLDFPYHGDEVDEGDIALDMLNGHLDLYYPQNEGNEPLYQLVLTPFFAVLGDVVVANRFPSAAWSTVLIALMYVFGNTLFRSRRIGVMAAALTAALWWPTVFGRLGLREISQAVMEVPALIGLILALRAPTIRQGLKAGVVGGIFAALTVYTFLSGRGFPVIVVLFLIYALVVQRDQVRKQWRALLIYVILSIGASVLLLAYLNAHPELDFHVRDLGTRSWLTEGSIDGLMKNVSATLGMFTFSGDMNWVRNIPGRPVFPGPEGLLFYLGIALCVWRWRKPEYVLPLIVVAVMLAPNVLTEDPPRWTRSIGILPGLLVIPVLPVEWAWARVERWGSALQKRQRWVQVASTGLAVLLGVSIYARTAIDMFQTWIDNPGVYWMTLAFYDSTGKYINQSPDSRPLNYVMDFYIPWRKHNIQRTILRKEIPMRYTINNALVFPDNPQGWRVAYQVFAAPPQVLLKSFLNLDAPLYVDARVEPSGERPLRVYDVPRAKLDEHLVGAKEYPVVSPSNGARITSSIQVDDVLEFLGYEIVNKGAGGGDTLSVFTYWRVLQRPPDMAIFVHLLDSAGRVVAQYDGFDVVVDDLAAGDIVVQLHQLNLPGNLARGDYRLELGAYVRENMKRFPLSTGEDSVWLQIVRIGDTP